LGGHVSLNQHSDSVSMKIAVNNPYFLKSVPSNPGVYRFFDDKNNLLYVGKAINLNKRVKSYFQKKSQLSPRIAIMVAKINLIELTITDNEHSALILENNLIKQLKPKYNIIFRDDKTYPLIRLTDHKYPKIEYFRGKTHGKASYFGPYPNAWATKQAIDTIQKIFKLRTCSDTFFSNRSRPCMLHQIDRCSAPCVNLVTQDEYRKQISLAQNFLHGKYNDILRTLDKQMNTYADKMEFEAAATTRDKISLIQSVKNQQIITQQDSPLSCDIITTRQIQDKLYVYLIVVRNGMYVGDNHFVLSIANNSTISVLEVFLENYYLHNKHVQAIVIDYKFNSEFIHFFTRVIGVKIIRNITQNISKLINMAHNNLNQIIETDHQDNQSALQNISELVNCKTITRIECIDISHNHGENTIAAITVFDNNKLDSSQYRRYNLPNEINGNDILAMTTVLNQRLSKHNDNLPQLILVDGGNLQFNVAKNIITTHGLCDKIKVMAIFKGEKRNPTFDRLILDNQTVISTNDAPLAFKLLQSLRDEAHRFAITGHRKKQVKKMTYSVLEEIPQIGEKTRKALLIHFGSVKDIANASIEDLCQVDRIGRHLANVIYSYFH